MTVRLICALCFVSGCFEDHLTAGFRGQLTETCETTVGKRKGGVAVSALASTLTPRGKWKRSPEGLTVLKVQYIKYISFFLFFFV